MYVATVIPIGRGIPFDTLSYYIGEQLPTGTLVTIPFGKQAITGIVCDTIPLTQAKTAIKSASFSLKKVKQVLATIPYFEHTVEAIIKTGSQTLAPIGAIAGSVLPQHLFEYIHREKIVDLFATQPHHSYQEHVCLGTTAERTDEYKRLIRSAFADKTSVVCVAPTIRELTKWHKLLEKGIQKHVITFHSKVSKKDLRTNFSLLKSSERPLLIFATPSYAVLPRADIGTLIVESESSSLYKTNDRFAIDLRIFLRAFASAQGYALYWGDTLPRLETLARLEEGRLPRNFVPDKLHIVPIEHYRTALPTEVIELIRHAQVKGRRLFIYTHRKGLAPLSRCSDCGTLVSCPTCTLPMVLRSLKSDGGVGRSFICTHCGDALPADHTCSYCGSWNITPLAIGSESIAHEISRLVGEEAVFTIDDDTTPESALIEKTIHNFAQKKFAILVGTIKALPYLKGVHYSIVPFVDRMLATPSITTTEQIIRTVLECNEHSSDGVLVCTRNSEFPFLKDLAAQKLNAIIDEELSTRKVLGYPPYGTIIKISLTVPEGFREKIKKLVDDFVKDYDTTALPARRISLGSMKLLMVWIVKADNDYIERDGPALAYFLDTLRYPYRIEQNPERF